jgi:ABC-type uncharacterized transport system substrate-binding protein
VWSAWLVVVLVACGAAIARAHPHVFIVHSVVLPVKAHGVDGVGFVFTFDALFSAIILRDAGQGDAETVSGNHARILRQLPFEVEVTFNGVPVALEEPTDLSVTTAGGRVTYRFLVPFRTPLLPPGTIDISVDDSGFFAAFVLRDPDPVQIQASGAFVVTCERARTSTGAPGPLRCRYEDRR